MVCAAAAESLPNEVKAASAWASGGKGGNTWYDSLCAGAALANDLALAKTSLLTKAGHKYTDAASSIATNLSHHETATSRFSATIDEHLLDFVKTTALKLTSSYVEGLLCSLYSNEMDPNELKRTVKGIKVQADSHEGFLWDDHIQKDSKIRAQNSLKLK